MWLFAVSVAAVAEEAQQVEEEVYEVEVQAQGAYCGEFACGFCGSHGGASFDRLGVPGGESYEDKYAEPRDNPFKSAVCPENVNNRAEYQPYECHEQHRAPFGEVLRCQIAVDAHGSESSGGYEESFADGNSCVHKEYGE